MTPATTRERIAARDALYNRAQALVGELERKLYSGPVPVSTGTAAVRARQAAKARWSEARATGQRRPRKRKPVLSTDAGRAEARRLLQSLDQAHVGVARELAEMGEISGAELAYFIEQIAGERGEGEAPEGVRPFADLQRLTIARLLSFGPAPRGARPARSVGTVGRTQRGQQEGARSATTARPSGYSRESVVIEGEFRVIEDPLPAA